jgi:hypothetical protein
MDTEKTLIGRVAEESSNKYTMDRVDLLDLLDEKFLPKDRVKSPHGQRHINILDVMSSSPASVKARIEEARKKKTEERKKKAMEKRVKVIGPGEVPSNMDRVDLLDLLDEHFLPKDRVKSPNGHRRNNVLKVMSSPASVKARIEEARKKDVEERKKKSMERKKKSEGLVDQQKYFSRKNDDENHLPSPLVNSVLDVIDRPPSSPRCQG